MLKLLMDIKSRLGEFKREEIKRDESEV